MKYEYDQLHRIKAANAFQNTTLLSTNQWDLGAGQINTKYQVLYSYDENGNMATLNRSGSTTANYFLRDRFTYRYYNQTNRLEYVIDIKGSAGPQDMDTQAPGNYAYYEDGNLKSDVLDNISQIHWNVANKIDRIEFTAGATGKPEEIQFRYDAMGERVTKIVKPTVSDDKTWTYTYYVRDVQGNVMATYERNTFLPSGTTPPPGYTGTQSDWNNLSGVEAFILSEHHLYGSSRLGILQTDKYLALKTPETAIGLLSNLPSWYSPFEPLPGDPCGCNTCPNPPCDPCWCIPLDCVGGQPCSGDGCPDSPDCYGENWPTVTLPEIPHNIGSFTRGRKRYELSNHLGNVLAVISDRKLQIDAGSSIAGYNPDIWAYHDYYPFGMTLPDRTWQAEGYRYGFNGKEADDEVLGEDLQFDYGFRIYDARIARFLSVDPLAPHYPWYTPYQFAGNKPIKFIDLDGLEEFPHQMDYDVMDDPMTGDILVGLLNDGAETIGKLSASLGGHLYWATGQEARRIRELSRENRHSVPVFRIESDELVLQKYVIRYELGKGYFVDYDKGFWIEAAGTGLNILGVWGWKGLMKSGGIPNFQGAWVKVPFTINSRHLGEVGELFLRNRYNFKSRTFDKTHFEDFDSGRRIDNFDPIGLIAREVKIGKKSYGGDEKRQFLKDLELLNKGDVREVVWHLYRNPNTGEMGLTKPFIEAFEKAQAAGANIRYVEEGGISQDAYDVVLKGVYNYEY